MKINIYIVVFGLVVALAILAGLSITIFNMNLAPTNVTVSGLQSYGPAPGFQGGGPWINSLPLNLSQLKGKVVLVDFWTYSCINCIRSIPHLEAWYKAYGNNGLVIIGVHTPEFQFEHNYSNVYNAVQRFNITYPVVLDNNYSIWDAYHNEYWPADYLIDANGTIRYEIFGEGNYNVTEEAIRALLKSAGYTIQPNLTSVPLGVNFSEIGTPELYLGWEYSQAHGEQGIGNPQGYSEDQNVIYTKPSILQNNTVYLSGEWYDGPDSIVAVNNSKVFLIYDANKVNVVAGVQGMNSTRLVIKLDGANLTSQYLGADARLVNGSGVVNVSSYRLYNLVASSTYGWHVLEIDAGPGFRLYTFTFG